MHTILVADDSVTIQKAVEIVFDKEPFHVVKVGSGNDAIAKAREIKPQLVLADHSMPDKSGYEVAEALRADPGTQGIPVLLLSGSSAPYDEGRARAAGVVGHVPKPFDCQTLLDRVRNLLGVAATAPGTAVGVPPSSTAPMSSAVAATPRPPGIPGGAAAMPRPPGAPGGGVPPRPAVSTTPAQPTVAPATSGGAPPRTPTPMPERSLDPFGFGVSGSGATTPTPSVPKTNPFGTTPSSTPTNMFGSGAQGAPATVRPAPMASPPSLTSSTPTAGKEPWKAQAASDLGVDVAFQDAPTSKPAPTTTNAASPIPAKKFGDNEFLEVGDIDVADIGGTSSAPSTPSTPSLSPSTPSVPRTETPLVASSLADTARITSKVDMARLAALDEARGATSGATGPASGVGPAPPGITSGVGTSPPGSIPGVTPGGLPPGAAVAAKATEAVVERAAAALSAGGPSREALSEEARQIVERIAWEVVPELAEVIIREEIQRLLKG